jgi:hypothetical protein
MIGSSAIGLRFIQCYRIADAYLTRYEPDEGWTNIVPSMSGGSCVRSGWPREAQDSAKNWNRKFPNCVI